MRVITVNEQETWDIVKQYARISSALFLEDASGSVWSLYVQNNYIPLNYVIESNPQKVHNWMEGFTESTIRTWIDECLVGVEEIVKPDTKLSMSSYPNPFKKSTMIIFSIPNSVSNKSGKLSIYDLSGTLIRGWEIKDAELEIVWDSKDIFGKSVVSGIYFCILEAGNSKVITKLILAK